MKPESILQQLRQFSLQSQGLAQVSSFGKGKKAVLKAIQQLGYVQIDTLSVVERAHHHTLWSRIPDYKKRYLEDLVDERQLFEYWFHAASYLPMSDFRFALPKMLHFKRNESVYYRADPKVMRYVLDTIRTEGPKRARDFESKTSKQGSWWNWKPTKLALERLFMQGDLMIAGRSGMQKTYDITERVLPSGVSLSEPSPLEFAEYLVRTYLRAYGCTTLKQITHLSKGALLKNNVLNVLHRMEEEGELQQIIVTGMPAFYVSAAFSKTKSLKPLNNISILSPFDNAIIHRDRTKSMFDYDYRIECYTPSEKRQFGYFCLPVLLGDVFVGRVDCKAHREKKELELIHFHIERFDIDPILWVESFVKKMKQFAVFNGCDTLKITKVSPAKVMLLLKKAVQKFTDA